MSKSFRLVLVLAGLVSAGEAWAQTPGQAAVVTPPEWTAFESQIADAKKTMMADPKAALDKARQANALALSGPKSD